MANVNAKNKKNKEVEVVEIQDTPITEVEEVVVETATEGVSIISPSLQSKIEEANGGVVISEEEVETPVKRVKVKTRENHRCCIGGTFYVFEQGVQQTVPEEVKRILGNAGLLDAL